jgi:hypothetical protein
MKLVCPKCSKEVGEVEAAARLVLTVHCPFDGHDFGVAVDPAKEVVAEVVSAADLDAVAAEQKAQADTASS